MAKIYLKFNSAVIKEISLQKDVTTFGRKPDNDIAIDNPSISGFHGKIIKEGEQYYVEDLNSTNGTFLNGQRVKKTGLRNKDQIGVARHVLEFVSTEHAVSDSAPAPVVIAEVNPQPQMLRQSLDVPLPEEDLPKDDSQITPPPPKVAPLGPAFSDMDPSKLPPRNQIVGSVKIISGAVNGQTEIPLKDLVTYIGTSDKAAIKIKGLLAPALAAAITRRPEGYFLKAIKAGYPKVNGTAISEQVLLENGTLLEVGGTNMMFSLPTPKKSSE